MKGDVSLNLDGTYPNNEINGDEGDDIIFGVGIEKEMVLRGGQGKDIIYAGGYGDDANDNFADIAYDDDYDGQIFVYGDDGHDKLYGAETVPY